MSNIWDEQNEYAEETQEEYVEEAQEQDPGYVSVLNQEVVRRIERAKLYETLLKHTLFGEGSAAPDIIDEVEAEIKAFVVQRIEVLMGIRPAEAAPSDFTADETKALKILAGRLLGQKPKQQLEEPELRQPEPVSEPTIRVVQARPRPPAQAPSRSVKVGQPRQQPRKTLAKRPKSANLSSTGQDLSQASSPKALPMPSPDAINAHVTMQAHKVLRSGKQMIGTDEYKDAGQQGGVSLGAMIKSID